MSNFKCSECGMINIDCGLGGFKTPREIELEKRVKDLEQKLNAQFAKMEEKLTAEEMKNYKLKEKLKIAEEALIEKDNYFKEIENIINKYKLTESVIKVTSINPLDVQEILNKTRKAKGVK